MDVMPGASATFLLPYTALLLSFPKINMPRKAEENSGLLEDIPETLTRPTSGTAPLLNFLSIIVTPNYLNHFEIYIQETMTKSVFTSILFSDDSRLRFTY